MNDWRNDDLWRDGSTALAPGSPLRSYDFWHYYFCLDHTDEGSVSRQLPPRRVEETWSAHFNLARFGDPSELGSFELGSLELTAAPYNSSIGLRWIETNPAPKLSQDQLGFWDRAHHNPFLFRWSEMRALVASLQDSERPLTPSAPSLATLLLAPFTAITAEDNPARCEDLLTTEIDRLGLLDEREVYFAARLGAMDPDTRWEQDQKVGWQLRIDRDYRPRTRIPHSLRHGASSDFPASNFLRLLRSVGIDDLP